MSLNVEILLLDWQDTKYLVQGDEGIICAVFSCLQASPMDSQGLSKADIDNISKHNERF